MPPQSLQALSTRHLYEEYPNPRLLFHFLFFNLCIPLLVFDAAAHTIGLTISSEFVYIPLRICIVCFRSHNSLLLVSVLRKAIVLIL